MNADGNRSTYRSHHWLCNASEQYTGCWLLEKVYENALVVEFRKSGLMAEPQKCIAVIYEGIVVGDYIADIVVDGRVIIEVKAAKAIDEIHQAQLLNYLKATGVKIGLILNFGTPRLGIKRMIR